MSDAPRPEQPPAYDPFPVESTERIYDSIWVGLRRDLLRLPGGDLQEHHVVEISSAVVVVPVRSDGKIVVVGQYRHATGKTRWELPAGRIGEGETPEEAARRELREETGHSAGRLVPLPGFHPTGGISAHYAHAFVALGCEEACELELEPAERLFVRCLEEDELLALLDHALIEDAFTALAFLYYRRWKHAGRLE